MTRSAVFPTSTSFSRPHLASAFSTSSCAVLLASGADVDMPASGSTSTTTVCASRTSAGSASFFFVLAGAKHAKRRTRERSRLRRGSIETSMQRKNLALIALSCEMGAIYAGFQAFWNDRFGSLVYDADMPASEIPLEAKRFQEIV